MKNMVKYILLVGIFGLTCLFELTAQDEQKKTTRIRVEYIKGFDGLEKVVATVRIREDRYLPFKNAEIDFYHLLDTSKTFLQKILTDENGVATYLISEPEEIGVDSSGFMTFVVEYTGDPSTEPSKNKVSVKRSDLKVSFLQEDSIKYIAVNANEILPDNSFDAIEGIDISFFIKGTFSYLEIGKKETDENGIARVEFPVDMPGDTAGVLTIVAKIIESDTYGSLESKGVMNWGKPVPLPEEKHRGLGDTDAPLWMVYTLIVLLSAVWFHYLYVIFTVIKIKLLRRSVQSS